MTLQEQKGWEELMEVADHFIGERVLCAPLTVQRRHLDAILAASLVIKRAQDVEGMAEEFHESYEILAPEYGYATRKASAVPWEGVPDSNKRLMIATCRNISAWLLGRGEKKPETQCGGYMPNVPLKSDPPGDE